MPDEETSKAYILGEDDPRDLLAKVQAAAASASAQVESDDLGEAEKCAQPPYDLAALTDLYESNSTNKACIDAKAAAEVGYGWELEWVGEGDAPDDPENDPDWVRLAGSQFTLPGPGLPAGRRRNGLLAATNNRGATFSEVMQCVVIDLEATGNAYMELTRNGAREIDGLYHGPSAYMMVLKDRTGFRQRIGSKTKWFRNAGDLEGEGLTAGADTELIHFRKYTPKNTYYGVPDCLPAITAMAGDREARDYNVDFFEHNTVPRMVLIIEGGEEPGKELIDTVQRYLQSEVKGKGHKTMVLWAKNGPGAGTNPKIRLEPLGVGKTEDASFLEYRKANRDEVLMVHRVPPSKITIVENANLANSRDQDKTFYEEVVRPSQHYLESLLNHFLVHHENGLNIANWEIRFREADLTSDREDAEVAEIRFRAGLLDQNTWLQEHGADPIEELTEPLVPGTLKPLSQIVKEPEPTPPTLLPFTGAKPPVPPAPGEEPEAEEEGVVLSDRSIQDLAKALVAEGGELYVYDEEQRGWGE